MFNITFLFSIFILIQKTIEYYNLRYGHIIINYYNTTDCINNSVDQIIYPTIDDDGNIQNTLNILNKDGNISKNYEYSFDFFSSQIYYTRISEEETDDEDNIDKRAYVCNGLCIKRYNGSDIIVEPDLTNASYEELNETYQYYSCIYNNIIKTADIKIDRFNDNKCKNQIDNSNTFKGNEFCWKIDENQYLRPLYFEDSDKKIYYHSYPFIDCTTDEIDYISINENYLICNNKCQINRTNHELSYKCDFNPNFVKFINLKKTLLLLYLLLFLK